MVEVGTWVARRDLGWGGQGSRVARVAGNYVREDLLSKRILFELRQFLAIVVYVDA